MVLAGLLALCAFHRVRTVAGLEVPPDPDLLRDIGYIQGILDGNWFGDPVYAGEWRYHPPLVSALGALLYRLSGATELPRFWLQAGPWLNLLAPLGFFLASRRLLASAPAAAVGTAVFVVFNGAISAPWNAGGYTPWPFAPSIAQAVFFGAAWLIHARVASARWRDAVLIGVAIGLSFLAHAVPAVVLTAVVTAAGFAAQGLRLRTVAWLAAVAAAQLAVMMLLLGPILLHYPDGMIHFGVALHSDWLMEKPLHRWVLVMNTPGLAALAVTLLLRRAAPLGRTTSAMLAAWIGVCSLFLLRHYACPSGAPEGDAEAPAVCRVFLVTVHHYHLYLQVAWTCLMGHAGWHLARLWAEKAPLGSMRLRVALAAGLAAVLLLLGGYGLVRRSFDRERRALAVASGGEMDLMAYRWMVAHTAPGARFAAELEGDDGPMAFTVMAAGRSLVSSPVTFSNPYVRWDERDAERRAYLAAAAGTGSGRVLCQPGAAGLWIILPKDATRDEERLEPVYGTEWNTIYRVAPGYCRSAG